MGVSHPPWFLSLINTEHTLHPQKDSSLSKVLRKSLLHGAREARDDSHFPSNMSNRRRRNGM